MYLQVFAFWSSKDSTCPCKRVGPPRIASKVPGANELEYESRARIPGANELESMSLEPVYLSANSESQPDEDRDWNVAYSKLTVRITLTPVRSEGFGIPDSQNFECLSQTQDSRLSHGPAVSTRRPSASPHPRPGNTEWGSPLRVQWAPHPARPKRGPAGPGQTRAIPKRFRAKPGPSPNGLGWPVGHPAHLPSLLTYHYWLKHSAPRAPSLGIKALNNNSINIIITH
ncbi:hypothetical protein PGT21_016909 [Puccinia graminis f. sp. tritici]|uniref:Uncharacterized protein n=1 Tax=Puccinia graminis f. sp. tritici TaxID=56615 RepID=A0A5B0MCG7_PUCGR|nr:hypothetical protein PGT21_016909 [Puccinia graminis f. sp. tritici]